MQDWSEEGAILKVPLITGRSLVFAWTSRRWCERWTRDRLAEIARTGRGTFLHPTTARPSWRVF